MFSIFCNKASQRDFQEQLTPFLQELGMWPAVNEYYHKGNINIFFTNCPYGDRHSNWLHPFTVYMVKYFAGMSDKRKSYIAAMYQDGNAQIYRYHLALAETRKKLEQSQQEVKRLEVLLDEIKKKGKADMENKTEDINTSMAELSNEQIESINLRNGKYRVIPISFRDIGTNVGGGGQSSYIKRLGGLLLIMSDIE